MGKSRHPRLLLATIVGFALTPPHAVVAEQPSFAAAAQQVAAQAGVSPEDVEILSVTYAGTETRGNDLVEIWNIQYRIKSRASLPSSTVPTPADQLQGSTHSSFSWPFDSSATSEDGTVPDADETFSPLPQTSDGDDGPQSDQTLFTGLAISLCVLVFVGLAVVVGWQIMRVRSVRTNGSTTGPPPIPQRSNSVGPN
jgi:hypothetical protein